MNCRYVWLNQNGAWLRCELDEDHETSHKNGIYSVARQREETWQHYWLEQDEKITTVEIPIGIIDEVSEAPEAVEPQLKILVNNLFEQPKKAIDAVGIE